MVWAEKQCMRGNFTSLWRDAVGEGACLTTRFALLIVHWILKTIENTWKKVFQWKLYSLFTLVFVRFQLFLVLKDRFFPLVCVFASWWIVLWWPPPTLKIIESIAWMLFRSLDHHCQWNRYLWTRCLFLSAWCLFKTVQDLESPVD